MKLNQIAETKGSRKPKKRVGRGPSSGLGKTAGKGQKGQKSRSGVALAGFEGGQMPLYRRLPKRGFTNIFRKRYREINLNRVQSAIEAGKIDVSKPIDLSVMQSAGLLKTPRDGVRLLARGTLNSKVTIEVSGASKSAIDAVEKAGGKVVIISPTPTRAGNEA
ncbi:MAG: 50S ribosomal protein L15 [Alphaproteobacteria bacterium]